jgi:hypothetical protein
LLNYLKVNLLILEKQNFKGGRIERKRIIVSFSIIQIFVTSSIVRKRKEV